MKGGIPKSSITEAVKELSADLVIMAESRTDGVGSPGVGERCGRGEPEGGAGRLVSG